MQDTNDSDDKNSSIALTSNQKHACLMQSALGQLPTSQGCYGLHEPVFVELPQPQGRVKQQGQPCHITWIRSCSLHTCNQLLKHSLKIHSQLLVTRRPFLILTIIYTIVLFGSTALQHFLLGTQGWDLGLFEQFNWLIANGHINTISSLRDITPLQDHFALLLLPIALIYKLLPNAYTLLALQSLALGSLTALSAELCRRRNIAPQLTWALAIAITLNPYSFLVNRGEFHIEVLTLPLMLLAITETTQKRRWLYYASLLLSLFAKSAQALFGFGLALYALARGQRTRAGITAGISLAWWLIASEMASAGGDYINLRLGYLGGSKLEIITTLISKPWTIFTEASPESILVYTVGLSLPFLAKLRLRSWPALLGASPIYLTNLISASGIQRELNHHYSVGILAFLIAGCIDSMSTAPTSMPLHAKRILASTALLGTTAFLSYGRIGYYSTRYLPRMQEAMHFQQAKRVIPDGASVLAMRNYVSHMAGRLTIRPIESDYGPIDQYEWIVLPAPNVPIEVGGKLIAAGRRRSGVRIKHVASEAEANGMQCNKANSSIVICSRS